MFENFLIWYKNDPTAKNKIAFFVGLAVFFPVLFTSIWWINSPRNQNSTQTQTQSSISRPQITNATFENSPQLELIDPQALGNLSQIYFQKDQIFSFSQNGNLKVDGQNLPLSPSFSPLSFYNESGFLIINEQKQTTIFDNKSGIFSPLENGISQVLPFENKFYYLFGRGNMLTIRSADNISLSQNIATLTSFNLPDVNSWAEMRAINGQIFVFIYQGSTRQGEIFVQKLEKTSTNQTSTSTQNTGQNANSLQLVQTWKDIKSLLFGKNQVVATQSGQNEPYTTKIINFKDFSEFPIDNQKIRALNLKGQIWAERCSFENQNLASTSNNLSDNSSQTQDSQGNSKSFGSLFCLVKNEDVFVFSSSDSDQIVKVENEKVEKVLDSLIFSASYIYSNQNQIYIINPIKDLLYRFKV